MLDKKYIDIKVVDGGWQIDAGQQPTQCSNLYSVAQDIKHAIMESGLARELIAERSPILRSDVLIQVEQLAEQDVRIIPGTAIAIEVSAGEITLTADTYEYGSDMSIEVGNVEIKTIFLDVDKPKIEVFTGVQIGEAIIADGDYWEDSARIQRYSLLNTPSTFTQADYPILWGIYQGVLEEVKTLEGSPFPYKIVADLQGGSND